MRTPAAGAFRHFWRAVAAGREAGRHTALLFRPAGHSPLCTGVFRAVVLVAVPYTALLLGPSVGTAFDPVVDGWLNGVFDLLVVVAVVTRAWAHKRDRAGWVWIGAALLSAFATSIAHYVAYAFGQVPPLDTWTEAGFALFYPLLAVGLALLLKSRVTGSGRGVWLDGAIAGTTATGLGVLLVHLASTPSTFAGAGFAGVYAVGDLVLLGFGTTALYMLGRFRDITWLALCAAFGVFGTSDLIAAHQFANGTFHSGGSLELGWLIARLALTAAAWCSMHEPTECDSRRSHGPMLGVPGACALLTLAVLYLGTSQPLPTGVAAVSLATSVGVLGRTALAVAELRRSLAAPERMQPSGEQAVAHTVSDLRRAIVGGELVVHYQAQFDVRSGRRTGAEALVRWEHPRRGLVGPAEFVGTAEASGLITALTSVVLESSIHQGARWHREGRDLRVAVNVSPSTIVATGFVHEVAGRLARHGLPAHCLVIEVTEELSFVKAQDALAALSALRRLGVGLSVDDYGTGYSTLAYLKDLPFTEVKLDRSFVATMAADSRCFEIVHSTVELAHALGMQVVAEGIEDIETLAAARAAGCDIAQGFLLARPCPAPDV